MVDAILETSIAQAINQGWRPPPSQPNMKALSESDILIVCIVNAPDNYLREHIKKWSEVERGIATQVSNVFL